MDTKYNMKCGIYKIVNLLNGKIYVGSSRNIHGRWYDHVWELDRNKHYNSYLQRAWNKYGKSSFKFEILEEVPKEALLEKEQFYIDLTECANRSKGYNLKDKATYCPDMSQESKDKISNSLKGRVVSEETRKKISESQKGKKGCVHTPEAKKKMSESKKGENNYWYGKISHRRGKKMSEASKEKMRAAKGKPIAQYLNEEKIAEFKSAREAERATGVSNKHIFRVLVGKRKTAGGFAWQYI